MPQVRVLPGAPHHVSATIYRDDTSLSDLSPCALCKQPKPLCDSHIIPAFVGKWLKETSATVYLRSALSPDLRQQDLLTKRLLCADCEGRFSGFERLAAERLVLPYMANHGRV